MKLVLQIALGVFLGGLASQLSIDAWHAHRERLAQEMSAKLREEQEKVRVEHGERIRALMLQGRQVDGAKSDKSPAGFIPEDIQAEQIEQHQ
jgi:hypothetical protein